MKGFDYCSVKLFKTKSSTYQVDLKSPVCNIRAERPEQQGGMVRVHCWEGHSLQPTYQNAISWLLSPLTISSAILLWQQWHLQTLRQHHLLIKNYRGNWLTKTWLLSTLDLNESTWSQQTWLNNCQTIASLNCSWHLNRVL